MLTDWLMVIITAIYVVATIFICIYNGKSASAAKQQSEIAQKQMKEMVDQYNAVNRPMVTVRFDIIRSGLLCFVIENEGPLPAREVQIKVNDAFLENLSTIESDNRLADLNNVALYLASQQKLTLFIGSQVRFTDIAKVPAIFDISYNGTYVPYKIGKLQIQGFSEPTTPKNKITELSHYAEGRPVKTTGGLFAWKARKEAEIF